MLNFLSGSRNEKTILESRSKATNGYNHKFALKKEVEEKKSQPIDETPESERSYCICKKGWTEEQSMCCCDSCDNWYHLECLDTVMPTTKTWFCPKCLKKESTFAKQSKFEVVETAKEAFSLLAASSKENEDLKKQLKEMTITQESLERNLKRKRNSES